MRSSICKAFSWTSPVNLNIPKKHDLMSYQIVLFLSHRLLHQVEKGAARVDQTSISDYFYGEESEQFSYFRIPRLLVRSKKFKTLSTDAKLLYGLIDTP